MKIISDRQGISVLEAIFGLAIFALFFIGSLSIYARYLSTYDRSREVTRVKNISETSFEAVQSIAYNDWSQMSSGTYGITLSSGKWQLASNPDKIDNKFKRTIKISKVSRNNDCNIVLSGGENDPDTKHVTTTIAWQTNDNTTTRSFGKYITRWNNPTNCLPVLDKNGVVFTKDGEIKTLSANGKKVTGWDPGDVDVIGPMKADFDSDGLNAIVYVKNKNKIKLIDNNDGSERDIQISSNKTKDESSLLAVGNWDGSGTSTFYTSDKEDEILQVDTSESPQTVAKPDNGVKAVSGNGDIDGDGTSEFVFVDTSQSVRYIEPADNESQTFSQAFDNVGENDNFGIGEPTDFNDDNQATVPVINSSNEVVLVDSSGKVDTIISSNDSPEPAKAPVASSDIDGDGTYELVFIDKSGGSDILKFIDEVRNSNTVQKLEDDQGNTIEADKERGVAGADT